MKLIRFYADDMVTEDLFEVGFSSEQVAKDVKRLRTHPAVIQIDMSGEMIVALIHPDDIEQFLADYGNDVDLEQLLAGVNDGFDEIEKMTVKLEQMKAVLGGIKATLGKHE